MIEIILGILFFTAFTAALYGAVLTVRDKQMQWEQRKDREKDL
tara:strand:+ start:1156 stop:1284 length:129 start_codon:yes stop_codon:yes gene_type:complete